MATIKGKIFSSILVLLLALGQAGCGPRTGDTPEGHSPDDGHDHGQPAAETSERQVRIAVAELEPTEGNEARGTVTFTQVEEGIFVVAELTGLSGPGERGFHIHEHGDCSAPDATSAGGHFNPEDKPHGAPDQPERHVGDLGNLTVDDEGKAEAQFVDPHLSFTGPHSILGRAVIVHAGEDDLETQPTGDAGARVACGVIEVSEHVE